MRLEGAVLEQRPARSRETARRRARIIPRHRRFMEIVCPDKRKIDEGLAGMDKEEAEQEKARKVQYYHELIKTIYSRKDVQLEHVSLCDEEKLQCDMRPFPEDLGKQKESLKRKVDELFASDVADEEKEKDLLDAILALAAGVTTSKGVYTHLAEAQNRIRKVRKVEEASLNASQEIRAGDEWKDESQTSVGETSDAGENSQAKTGFDAGYESARSHQIRENELAQQRFLKDFIDSQYAKHFAAEKAKVHRQLEQDATRKSQLQMRTVFDVLNFDDEFDEYLLYQMDARGRCGR